MPECDQESDTLEIPYRKRLPKAAREEFKTFWTAYRWCATLAMILTPPAILVFRHGWRRMFVDWNETLANGFIGLVGSLVVTALIALYKGAKNLDTGLQQKISDRGSMIASREDQIKRQAEDHETEVTTLQETIRAKSPLQKSHDLTVANELAKLNPDDLTMLRFMLHHDEMGQHELDKRFPHAVESVISKTHSLLKITRTDYVNVGAGKRFDKLIVGQHFYGINPQLLESLAAALA